MPRAEVSLDFKFGVIFRSVRMDSIKPGWVIVIVHVLESFVIQMLRKS